MAFRERRSRIGFAEISRPVPIPDLGHVFEVLANVLMMFVELRIEEFGDFFRSRAQPRDMLECFDGKVVAAHLIEDDHVERRGRRTPVHVASDVEARFIGPGVNHRVDDPAIVMEREDDVGILREELVERHVVQAVRMIVGHHQRAQIDHIDDPHLDPGHVLLQEP